MSIGKTPRLAVAGECLSEVDGMSYSVPPNEAGRLAAVRALNIVGTPPEIAFDEISHLAAQISQCPVSYITFADDDRFWLKAKYGLPPDFNECPREISFCATTICGAVMVIAPNLREDNRFSEFPSVTGDPHLRFYCGIPLVTESGYALGTLTVMDFEPRKLTFEQTEALHRLSRQVMTQLELRRQLIEFHQAMRELDQAHTDLAAEKARTEELLANILPSSIAQELKKSGKCNRNMYPRRRYCSLTSRASPCWPKRWSRSHSSGCLTNTSLRSTRS
jgi:GAF domain-containing protein